MGFTFHVRFFLCLCWQKLLNYVKDIGRLEIINKSIKALGFVGDGDHFTEEFGEDRLVVEFAVEVACFVLEG